MKVFYRAGSGRATAREAFGANKRVMILKGVVVAGIGEPAQEYVYRSQRLIEADPVTYPRPASHPA